MNFDHIITMHDAPFVAGHNEVNQRHATTPFLEQDRRVQEEFLVKRVPKSVQRNGRGYVYKNSNDSLFLSFTPPHAIQWQNGP